MTGLTSILTDPPNRANAGYLHDLLSPSTGLALPVAGQDKSPNQSIHLRINPQLAPLGREGYRLDISTDAILVEGSDPAGVFYGIQSLRQLFPIEVEEHHNVPGKNWRLACLAITDKPRFAWRGFMLDEGRHFQGKQTVLQTLDLMALQKLNVFHWHLTEDEGWRFEIKKYPKLTEIGSRRDGTSYRFSGKMHNGIPHAGFYSQTEIREIVEYAAKRHITIVPEVEMPGHSLAALAAYPELSCTGGPFTVATHFGIFDDIYCAGKEAVFTFLENVLGEVMELFPSNTIHIGGDEAPRKRWKACPDCQRRMREENLKNERALQLYFINRMATFLEAHGRQAMVWNDMLQEGLHAQIALQFWVRGRKKLIEAIRNEQRATVMSTYLDAYLDHAYSLMPLSRAYRFEPIPKELDEKDARSILGLEFPLWTEWIPSKARLDYQVYPRLPAMAETGWTSKEGKDISDFRRRLPGFLERLDRLGIAYAPLQEAEPSRLRQTFGIFSIPKPQTAIADENSRQSAIL